SQVADVFFKSMGREAAIKEVCERAGSWFDPLLARAFADLASGPAFWDALAAPDLPLRVLALEPQDLRREVDDDYLDDIALAFAKVIDAKSPYTAGHSERVAVFADLIAEEMGESPEMRRTLRRAALLHDVGKLGISNTILDKPGKLTDEEFAEIRKHPVHSGNILTGIPSFRGIAEIGRDHHEKLNGRGYPHGISGSAISHATRIVSLADIFDALTAERPYRGPMPVAQALGIMEKDVGHALDGDGFEALVRSMNRANAAAA
ncbi:MAG: HD-GYP domain-containing protein, partial [Rhizobiales bacterium]|nr:HD-GYP domain-containing protein [Hyphomicrobiales bacterium]